MSSLDSKRIDILVADQAATRTALKQLDSNVQEVLAQVQASMLSLAQSVSILAKQVQELQQRAEKEDDERDME